MTALSSVLVMLAGLLRDLIQLAVSPSGLMALAGTVLAGAVFAAVLALLSSVADAAGTTCGRKARLKLMKMIWAAQFWESVR